MKFMWLSKLRNCVPIYGKTYNSVQFFANIQHKMPGQTKLSSFFPLQTKRSSSDTDNEKTTVKKPRTGKENIPTPVSPSQEKQQQVEENEESAPEKLSSPKMAVSGAPAGIAPSWADALSVEFDKQYFKKLQDFVNQERKSHTIFPPSEQVYTWTQTCDIKDVKVVILGQDPYHNVNQAHGLCFSVPQGVKPPPSLENMYKELTTDISGFKHPGHGNLTGWATQGVLLLNAVLTVKAHTPNSHKDKGWEKFTDAVISWLNKNQEGIVFMLWGAYAQKKGSIINTKRHCVLKSTHPSPLSAYRGFLGCHHFSKANEYLTKAGKNAIYWKQL